MHAMTPNSQIASTPEQELTLSRIRTQVTNQLVASMATFVHDLVFIYQLLRHPKTPWYAKGLFFLPMMYLCSPIQLIPGIIPVIGQMDDVFVIWIAKKFARKLVDANTRRECQDAADATKLPLCLSR